MTADSTLTVAGEHTEPEACEGVVVIAEELVNKAKSGQVLR